MSIGRIPGDSVIKPVLEYYWGDCDNNWGIHGDSRIKPILEYYWGDCDVNWA